MRRVVRELTCDHDECERAFRAKRGLAWSAMRHAAGRLGWYGVRDRDYCPEHADDASN